MHILIKSLSEHDILIIYILARHLELLTTVPELVILVLDQLPLPLHVLLLLLLIPQLLDLLLCPTHILLQPSQLLMPLVPVVLFVYQHGLQLLNLVN